MGGNSRKLAEEEFDWSKIAERYLEVYNEIVCS
jgi:glycosyltransferase involved in cell wall biosynthesis